MRYLSLDFFRGLTIALMIVVNDPGTWSHVYAPLRHAEWHGCTPTDLVFPFFLFIVGVSLWFSFSKFNQRLTPDLTRKILRRTALIFLIGLALNAYPFFGKDWSALRIMGVLQRIALAYGLGAFLCVLLPRATLAITGGLMLAVYWTLLHLGGGADPYSLGTNLVRTLDIALLGESHLYKGFGMPFDPEGLLGMFPAAVTVILGYLTGSLIAEHSYQLPVISQPVASDQLLSDETATGGQIAQSPNTQINLVFDLLWYGTSLGAAGLLWGLAFPINKPLWTSSYVLYAGGLAMIFLAVCVWALDIRGWTRAAKPFLVFGANPLFAFVLSGLLVKTMALIKYTDAEGKSHGALHWVYQNIFYRIDPAEFGSLLYALCYTAVIWAVCWVLYQRKIFIKI